MTVKVLIFGSSGMAGSMIANFLSTNYEVKTLNSKEFDATKDDIPNLTMYDYVINCIGVIKQKISKENINTLSIINSELPHKLDGLAKKLIHISSDCVFSGQVSSDHIYSKTDDRDAEDDYGRSKAMGEPTKNTMTLRTSIIGPAKDNYGLFEWFRHTDLMTTKGFINHLWSGITTLELAKIIDGIILTNMFKPGLYQIASNKISKYELLNMINKIFDLNKTIMPHEATLSINRVLQSDFHTIGIERQLYDLKEYMQCQL